MIDVAELGINIGVSGVTSATKKLDKLAESLGDVAMAQASVDENQTIDINVNGLDELALANAGLRGLESADVGDFSFDMGGRNDDIFSDFDPAEQATAASFVGPTQFQRSSGSSTTTATPDGGGKDGLPGFSRRELSNLSELFGAAFDGSGILRNDGQVTDAEQVLKGSFGDRLDEKQFVESLLAGDIDRDALDTSKVGNVRKLIDNGLLDLPEGQGPLGRFKRFVANIDATTLNNLFARLVPLLATFIGALPAAIGGVVALGVAAGSAAAALAAVGGLAALGVALQDGQLTGEGLREAFKEIKRSFIEAFAPLAETLAPIFGRLVDDVQQLFGELARRGGLLLELGPVLAGLGDFLVDQIPKIVAAFGQLGKAALPVFAEIGEAFSARGFARGIASFLADVIPTLAVFTSLVTSLIPVLLQLSTGFLQALSALFSVVSFIGRAINLFGIFGDIIPLELVGAFVGILLTAITAEALLTTVTALLNGSLASTATIIGSKVLSALAAYKSFVFGATTATAAFARAVLGLVAALAATGIGLALVGAGIGAAGQLVSGLGPFTQSGRTLSNFNSASSNLRQFGNSRGFGSTTDTTSGSSVTFNTVIEETNSQAAQREQARTTANQQRILNREMSGN